MFIASDLLPSSLVESPQFHSFMEAANPQFQVPGRKHLSTKLLPQRSSEIRKDIQNILRKAPVVCVTVDIWSSRQLRSYLGITAHVILDWSLKSVMLACSRFHGSHTSDAIMEEFLKCIAEFEITSKVSFIVSDSAANMAKAFSLPGFEKTYDEDSDDDSDLEDPLDGDDLQSKGMLDFYDELVKS